MKYLKLFSRCSLCLVTILLACNTKIEVTKLHIDTTAQAIQRTQKGFDFHTEYFVIKNPPRSFENLQTLLDSINAGEPFAPKDSHDYEYDRIYYKESRYTPRDYKEGKDLGFWGGKDDIIAHDKDLLVDVGWFRRGCNHGTSYMFYKNGKVMGRACKVIVDSSECK
jgi:hypothetical protein